MRLFLAILALMLVSMASGETVTLWANMSAKDPSGNTSVWNESMDVEILEPAAYHPQVAIQILGPDWVVDGTEPTYQIRVMNQGTCNLTNMTIFWTPLGEPPLEFGTILIPGHDRWLTNTGLIT